MVRSGTSIPHHCFCLLPFTAAIKPAVQGTLNALESAKSHAGIKRVILCSSEIAFHPPAANVTTPTVYSEEDRNDLSPQIVKEHGDKTDFMNIYATSKVMADQGAFNSRC